MSEEKNDEFALTVPNGLPAYPKWVGDVIVNTPDEHRELLAASKPAPVENKKVPDWGKK